jgi:site-specific DNA recombinase
MTRVALYARYSSDQQSATSIEDQLRICREQAVREGWSVTAVYKDAAISGASVILRPGIQTLLQDAQGRQFDVVMAEALDRISRDQADIATLFKHMQFAGIPIVTLAEGEISELHVGLKGTMNALFLKDLAKKTHRGLRGRVEQGKSGGGISYGYDIVRRLNSEGEPVRGERTINADQAEVVRRIFREFACGIPPRRIAQRLNAEGVPGPGGRPWGGTTVRGHAKRGSGLVNNELYIGRLIWNRQRFIKDPSTGRRVARLNPESDWIVTEVPELRIIDDATWQAAKARQAEITTQYAGVIAGIHAARNPLNRTHRPKSLLSGLLRCGCCDGPYTLRGQGRFACSNHLDTNTCSNGRTITRAKIEQRVLDGLRDKLMAPEAAAEAVRAFVAETNRLNHERQATRASSQIELTKAERAISGILDAIEDGRRTPALMARLYELEDRVAVLRTQQADTAASPVDLHPNIAETYRKKVARLTQALNQPEEREEAATALRGLIEKVVLTPGAQRGEMHATLYGEFGVILDWLNERPKTLNDNTPGAFATGVSLSLGAGVGFEPTTFRL